MEILIPRVASATTIFLILSSANACNALHLFDKLEDHFEFVEFVDVLGHGQSPILSNESFDKLDVTTALFF